MSKSVFVEYRGQGFWAFDVVTSVLLKHLVDAAAPGATATPWLSEIVNRWRVDTVLPDCFGVELDEEWSDEQIEVVIGLMEAACRILEARGEISAEEIENWDLLDGERIFARELRAVRSKAVTNLGGAITSLLKGTLPAAPDGRWWWYGVEDQPETIERRE